MHIYEVLKRPLQTEKTMYLKDIHQYAFEVDERANKAQIKEAVEEIFKVNVLSVNVMKQPAKRRRNPRSRQMGKKAQQKVRLAGWKKAVITVQADQRIELFEGV
ncbi:MAG TPA: 50S ribosomal protein L23 [Anaerolineae bacterium]